MAAQNDHHVDIRSYLRVVWRRKGLVLLCTLVALSSAFVSLRFIPRQYESKVTVLIQDRQPLANQLEQVMGGMTQPRREHDIDQVRMARMVGRIRSRPFLERVILLLGMHKDPVVQAVAAERQSEHPELAVDEIAIRILVDRLQSQVRFGASGAGVYQIVVADFTAENAQTLARWISELFVDTSIQGSLEYLRATHDFGLEQLKIYEDALRASEQALAADIESDVNDKAGAFGVAAENLNVARSVWQTIADEATTGRIRVQPLVASIGASGVGAGDRVLIEVGVVRDRFASLVGALREEVTSRIAAGAGGTWHPEGSYDVRKRELLRELETQSRLLFPDAPDEDRAKLVNYSFAILVAEAHESASAELLSAISGVERTLKSQPEDDIRRARLAADVEKNRKLLESFQAQLVASEISEAMETTKLGLQIEILDPAELPLRSSRPNRTKILAAALFLGPLVGIGLAFVGETVDQTLRTTQDFSRVVPEPVLGTTPLLTRSATRPGRIRRYWIPVSAAIVLAMATGLYLAADELTSRLRDSQPVSMTEPESHQ